MTRQKAIAAISLTGLLLASAAVANAASHLPRDEPARAESIDDDSETAEKKDRCANGLSCFALNAICYGEFRCKEERWWGCVRGECIPDKNRGY